MEELNEESPFGAAQGSSESILKAQSAPRGREKFSGRSFWALCLYTVNPETFINEHEFVTP